MNVRRGLVIGGAVLALVGLMSPPPLAFGSACAVARQISGSDLVAGASIKGMPDYIKAVDERDCNVAF
jgi:hypothetical protein